MESPAQRSYLVLDALAALSLQTVLAFGRPPPLPGARHIQCPPSVPSSSIEAGNRSGPGNDLESRCLHA